MKERKVAEVMFSNEVSGDSLIQLKDGKLIFYYFRENSFLQIYNDKTLQKIKKINLFKPINKYQKEKEKGKDIKDDKLGKELEDEKEKEKEEDDDEDFDYFHHWRKYPSKYNNNISIKELNNNLILIGIGNYLIESKSITNITEYKVKKELNEIILHINELPDNRIIIITISKIIILNQENDEYAIKSEYPIKDNWKIVSQSSKHRFYGEFHQYFSSYILPNDRLLLNSFSTELSYNGGCGTHPPSEFSCSKAIIINMKNFEQIAITKTFVDDAKYIILKDVIIIQIYRHIFIYDINSFELIKEIKDNIYVERLYKYDDKYLINLSEEEKRNNMAVYKFENNELNECCIINVDYKFDEIIGWNGYTIQGYNNKSMYNLKDKRIVMICHKKMLLLKISLD